MATGFYGADVEGLRQTAAAFDSKADEMAGVISSVTRGIQISAWFGPIAVKFRATWGQQHSKNLDLAVQTLRDQAKALRQQAQQQQDASAGGGSAAPDGGVIPGPPGVTQIPRPEGIKMKQMNLIDKLAADFGHHAMDKVGEATLNADEMNPNQVRQGFLND